MTPSRSIETEIKLRIASLEAIEKALRAAGFAQEQPSTLDQSVLWDREQALQTAGCALRLRRYAGMAALTWKGARIADPLLKIRPEIETPVGDAEALERILRELGYAPVLRMEKRRALWRNARLLACLDEAPFGCFLELEGDPLDIREAMVAMGLSESDAEPRSYPELFREHGLN